MHRERLPSGRPARSLLRQRNKLNIPGLVSHLTQHAVAGVVLFRNDRDRLRLLALLKEAAELFSFRPLAFCLMPNHLHLLIRQREANLPEAMRHLFREYSLYFNHKYQRRGHLFRGRFRQSACFDEYYLVSASIYIHLNPVRAGLARACRDYRWSSWALYDRDRPPSSFLDSEFVLRTLAADRIAAVRAYRKLLEEAGGGPGGDDDGREARAFALRLLLGGVEGEPVLARPTGFPGNPLEVPAIRLGLRRRPRGADRAGVRERACALRELLSRGYRFEDLAARLGVSALAVRKWLGEP